jgi:hypothetical protein
MTSKTNETSKRSKTFKTTSVQIEFNMTGQVLNLNPSDDRAIFEQFGRAWQVNRESSIFTYQKGLTGLTGFTVLTGLIE